MEYFIQEYKYNRQQNHSFHLYQWDVNRNIINPNDQNQSGTMSKAR